jgi:hypothetical protein
VPEQTVNALEEMCEELERDGDQTWLWPQQVAIEQESLVIYAHLFTDFTDGPGTRENRPQHSSWIIRCEGVVEHRILLGTWGGGFTNEHDHPLLVEHRDQHAEMAFTGAAADPVAAVGSLSVAHDRLMHGWRPVGRYLRPTTRLLDLLTYPRGTLGRGPSSLLDVYSAALEFSGVATNALDHRPPTHRVLTQYRWGWAPTDPDVQVLIIGNGDDRHESDGNALVRDDPTGSYVVARRFTTQEFPPS